MVHGAITIARPTVYQKAYRREKPVGKANTENIETVEDKSNI